MLNMTDFELLAGDPRAWDYELTAARALGDRSLIETQEDQHRRGRRTAQLVHGIYGWYVRAASSLDTPQVLANTQHRGGPLDGSYAAALAWGAAWACADPGNRELVVRRTERELYPDAVPDDAAAPR